jgi:hypothetical protein
MVCGLDERHVPLEQPILFCQASWIAGLWEAMNRTNNRRYDTYQSKTSRPIPLVSIMPEA